MAESANINVKLVDQTRAGFRDINNNLNQLKASTGSLSTGFAKLGAIIGSAFVAKDVVNTAMSFEDLRTTLSVLYKDTERGAQAFDSIKKFAQSSIFSVEQLTLTYTKLLAAGIEPTTQKLSMFQDVAGATSDTIGALQAVTDLYVRTTAGGLGLEELERLQDRGLPVYDILLEKLKLSRTQISDFGKSAAGANVILKALEEGFTERYGGLAEQRSKNLSQAFGNLGDAFQNAADQIGQAGLNKALNDAARTFTTFIDNNKELIKAIGEGLGGAITFVVENIKLLTAAFVGYFAVVGVGKILAIAKAFQQLNLVMLRNPLFKIAGIATGIGAALLGLEDTKVKIEEITDTSEKNNNEQKKAVTTAEDLAQREKLINFETQRREAFLVKIGRQLKQNFEIQQQGYELDLDRLTLSEQEIRRVEEVNKIREEGEKALLTLREQFESKTLDEQEAVKARYESERNEIKKTIDAQVNSFNTLFSLTERLRRRLADISAAESIRQDTTLATVRRQIETQNAVILGINDEIGANQALADIEQSRNAILTRNFGLSEIRSRQLRIAVDEATLSAVKLRREGESTAEAFRRILAQDLTEQGLEPEVIQQILKDTERTFETINDSSKELVRVNRELTETTRTFSYGWSKAMRDYVRDATDAAQKAERLFTKATQGMEDAIVNFVKTGKFEWKDFVNMMAEELLRSNIREIMASIFSGRSSAGGSGLLPTSRGGVQGMGTGILDILIGGVKSIFGGFFANGGMLGAGKFGIAGENGPELIRGPASVTPLMAGGTTSVTYNINAVDASSFKQLVAKDPRFIYAVTEQGRKSVPSTRR